MPKPLTARELKNVLDELGEAELDRTVLVNIESTQGTMSVQEAARVILAEKEASDEFGLFLAVRSPDVPDDFPSAFEPHVGPPY